MESIRERLENMPFDEWRVFDTIRDYYGIGDEEALEKYDNQDDYCVWYSDSHDESDVYGEWLEEIGDFEEIPNKYRYYLDFERMYRDFRFNGGEIVYVTEGKYIIFF